MPVPVALLKNPPIAPIEQTVLDVLRGRSDLDNGPLAYTLAEVCSSYLARTANDNISVQLVALATLLIGGERLFEEVDTTLRVLVERGAVQSAEYRGQMHYWGLDQANRP